MPPPVKLPDTQLKFSASEKLKAANVPSATLTLLFQFKFPDIVPLKVPDGLIAVSQSIVAPANTL